MADKAIYQQFWQEWMKLIDLGETVEGHEVYAPSISMLAGMAKQSENEVNSTTDPLDNGETFTGTWEQNNYPSVGIMLKTDQDCTLYFDFSGDGVNTDSTFPVNGFDVLAGVTEFHVAVKLPRYFRIRIVNASGSNQTYLRAFVYYGDFGIPNAPLNQTLSADHDAIVTRQIPPSVDVALGRIGGIQGDDKFGYVLGLGSSIVIGTPSTWVDIWSFGGQRTSPTTTFTPYIASDSASDTDIPILITYLDANGDEQTTTVNTDASDGRTPVSVGVTAQESYRGQNTGSGDLVGNVYCTTANNFTNGIPDNQDEVLWEIPVTDNQTQVAARRVPANKKMIISGIRIVGARDNAGATSFICAFQTRDTGGVWVTKRLFIGTSSIPGTIPPGSNIVLDALTDFRCRIRDIGTNGTNMRAEIDFDLVEV